MIGHRYSTAGMALIAAERLTQETGRDHYMAFEPRSVGDFQPFVVREVVRR